MSFIVTFGTLDTQFEAKFEKATIDSVSDQVDVKCKNLIPDVRDVSSNDISLSQRDAIRRHIS